MTTQHELDKLECPPQKVSLEAATIEHAKDFDLHGQGDVRT
jgi:hypothetical protein